jgi:ribose/xylose/arabinose/galactoside ABC-type transport system permease subunit
MAESSSVEPTKVAVTRRKFRLPDEIGVMGALAVMVAIISIARPEFLNPINLLRLFGNTAFYGMIALAMVFLLAIREIDLSVGWMFNFSAVIAATLMVKGIDPWLAALGGILFGALLGLFNATLAVGLNLPNIIVTLGTYSMFRGLSLVVNQSRAVVPPDSAQASSFFSFATTRLFGSIPMVGIIFVVMAVTLHLVLHRTRFGYRLQAIGSNPEAARLAGIPVSRVRLQTLILIGAVSGLSGVLFVGFRGAIDPTSGQDFALTVVAAAIIGGTPLSGGWGTVIGAVIGVVIIAVISSGIIFFGIDATWSTFVTGAVTVMAVVLDQIIKRQRVKRLERGDD